MVRAAIVGSGAWGTAIADTLAKRGLQVTLWAREPEVVCSINQDHVNRLFLAGAPLHSALKASGDLPATLEGAQLVVNVVPTQFIRQVWGQLTAASLPRKAIYVNASKGIEQGSLYLVSQIFEEIAPPFVAQRLVTLSGPSFAEEVVNQLPTSVTAASRNEELSQQVARWFHLPTFRVYSSPDPIGVQLGGALKNVMAIAAGASDGMGLGLNTRAALITRGLSEIARLGLTLGASPETFLGLSGMGDLVLTCTGSLSRNRNVGFRLGEGEPIETILASSNTVAEGVATAKSAWELAQRQGVDMPITTAVYGGLYEAVRAPDALKAILSRELKKDGI